jgi:hypothetical protein
LDGFAVQIALEDPVVDARRAFELSMKLAARELGFSWAGDEAAKGSVSPSLKVAPQAGAGAVT